MQDASGITLKEIGRDDQVVRTLYADFIREADGPLDPAVVDLDAEIAAGPPANLAPPGGILLLARIAGDPAGLGGVRHLDTPVAEVKSMYVVPAYRGAGLARELLAELERIARDRGCHATRLDTSVYLTAAVALYRSAGYVEVADYNGNPKADLWFERSLWPSSVP
jgi:GNAT superfamily N-acetyltransferase